MPHLRVILLVCIVDIYLAVGSELDNSCIGEIAADPMTHARWTKIPVDLTGDDENKQMKGYVDLAINTINKHKSLALESPSKDQLKDQLEEVYVKEELGFNFCLKFIAKSKKDCQNEVTSSCTKKYVCSAEIQPSPFLLQAAPVKDSFGTADVHCEPLK